jgi:hypothetical protein
MLAAYKLQLSRRAKQVSRHSLGTWGKQNLISAEVEERLIEGEGDFRLSPFPYPGLRSFDPKEGRLFFGRELSVTEVQKRLATYGVATVLGGSGSGKSSLVRAGLLPYLNSKRRIPGRVGSWYMAEFRPRMNPLDELADALADQVMLPLFDIGSPDLAEAMGLTKGIKRDEAKQTLRKRMQARFHEAQAKGSNAVRDSLLHFVDCELDEFDKLASHGVRVPGASLMLLLDQFEEAFRSEIVAGQREALLDLVVGLNAGIRRRDERNEAAYKGGLFLVLTMRSEELHRCAEHRGLSEVINRSVYLLELLDPDNQDDAKDLRKAIVQPARDVFDDWGLEYARNRPDAPFADDMSAWLLSGAGRRLPHQPDQLPLLQHALQATWHAAMRRWSHPDYADVQFEIRREDLPGQGDPLPEVPDLGKCLRVRADKAAERTREQFAEKANASKEHGEELLRATFRSLAHRDDRGNWTRRFSSLQDIKAFLAADQNFAPSSVGFSWKFTAFSEIFAKLQKLFPVLQAPGEVEKEKKQKIPSDQVIQESLGEFLIRGYLSGGNGSPYDISHEALIRNWPRFQDWLSGPESAARALERVVQEVDPRVKESGRKQLLDWIPAAVSEQLLPVLGPNPTLPKSWALHRLESILERSAFRERWQGVASDNDEPAKPGLDNKELAKAVLEEIDKDRRYVDNERRNEVRRKLARKFIAPAAAVGVLGVVVLWFTLQQSMAALYAAQAGSLLGTALSDRGAQWPPALRARVILRSVAYMETAASLGGKDRWVNILPGIFRFINQHLPTNTNEELQQKARRAFDSTSREVLGRQFAVLTDIPDQPVGKQSPNCAAIGTQLVDWQQLVPEPDSDEQRWKRAYRVTEAEAHGAKQGSLRLEFGAADHSGEIQLAASDIQLSLPSGAWLCLSPDATVLSLSDSSQNFPDIYQLQWTRCAPKSKCKSEQGRDWRVRYVPIQFAPGAQPLPRGYPCVISIRALPNERQAAKFQLTYHTSDVTACNRSLSSKIYAAEFFAGLAVPRAVQVPAAMKDSLTKCEETSEERSERVIYTCQLSQLIEVPQVQLPQAHDWKNGDGPAKGSQNNEKRNAIITIVKREKNEPDTFDVSVNDDSPDTIAAKVSLPAYRIDRAGITKSGDVLLQDDDADVTWRFVARKSRLQALLSERGNCGRPKLDIADEYLELDGLGSLDIDSACAKPRLDSAPEGVTMPKVRGSP